ncbi:SRPBCC family protein [Streptomonospora litoralis]|uniref:Polyketide cyclase / dehydrase and lipid transport n=1 Tax=Streptomonospora litoralis TaxID=2498135 RepID=A0A4V0ZKE6_9ACTN|nr:SRPBCC family protein [Streptomonospora litoralis]QBI56712.1 Polyketide cyclase / dehydrase and lipid transport [Streptomonospora litoralis]
MRFADGPRVSSEVGIGAGAARVWAVVADIAAPALHSPELMRVEWLDGATEPAVGARFAGHNRSRRLGEWRTVVQIVEFEPEHAFGWVVLDADGRFGPPADDPDRPMATWRYTLEPRSDGGTLLRQSARLGPGRSGLTAAIDRMPDLEEQLVVGRLDELRTGMEITLRGIKARAEQDD